MTQLFRVSQKWISFSFLLLEIPTKSRKLLGKMSSVIALGFFLN